MEFDPSKYRIIFMGTPDFSVPALGALLKKKYNIISVISQPDKPAGRGNEITVTAVKEFSLKNNLKVCQFYRLKENDKFLNLISQLKPDCIIVSAFGKIIPKEILNLPKFGCVNIHPSLLPKYRGASPIQTAILNGENKTGVTIIKLNEGLDSGDILASQTILIKENDTSDSMHDKLSKIGAELLIKTLPKYFLKKIKLKKQKEKYASFTNIITKKDGEINWNDKAGNIYNMVRAFMPWPGTFTFLNNKRVKILQAKEAGIKRQTNEKSGRIYYENDKIFVLCGNHTWLEILKLQMEGKKAIPAKEFIKGYKVNNRHFGK